MSAKTFWIDLVDHFFNKELCELDYTDFIELGEKHGLLREEVYDPKKHGPSDLDPGDPIFIPIKDFK